MKILKIPNRMPLNIFISGFFIFHYGIFMFGHLTFILTFFFMGVSYSGVGNNPDTFKILIDAFISIILGFIGLFISHGISFYQNYIKNEEYKRASPFILSSSPYKRIFMMHFTLIIGMTLLVLTKAPRIVGALFIIIKIIVDLRAHRKEHEF